MKLSERMGLTADELSERMSVSEFNERYILDCLDPSIEVRSDIHTAQTLQMLQACHSTKKVGPLSEYMFDPWRKKKEQSEEDIQDLLIAFTLSRGGKVSEEVLEEQKQRHAKKAK